MPAVPRPPDPGVDAAIGERVHTLLWRQRRRQTTLAAAIGVSESVCSKKLRGESAWSARQVWAAARHLDVSVGELFDDNLPGGPGGPGDPVSTRWSSHPRPSGAFVPLASAA